MEDGSGDDGFVFCLLQGGFCGDGFGGVGLGFVASVLFGKVASGGMLCLKDFLLPEVPIF
ncbi:hypothetical protein Hanom_Chr12g01119361 [Helianthus anomalus]